MQHVVESAEKGPASQAELEWRWLSIITVDILVLRLTNGSFIDVVTMILLPLRLPRFVRHRLPESNLTMFGEALLFSKCRQIFKRYQSDGEDYDPWTLHRLEDDLALLRRSGQAGWHICIKLLHWVSCIKNGPDYLEYFKLRLSWLFTIKAELLKADGSGHYEILLFYSSLGRPRNGSRYYISSDETQDHPQSR